ncbi:hypothetical protein DRQ09_01240 [candidate division KSB1 bacterium]|nr:MAG: hypothetical protein DRQ09_01240 [candidate division KSB1 bacterium]
MKFIKSFAVITGIAIFILNINTGVQKSIAQEKSPFKFEISFPSTIHSKPITGRVYVIVSRNSNREPRFQVSPTGVPIFGKNVENLMPGIPVEIDKNVPGYPLKSIKDIPPGEYYIQGFINIYTTFHRSDGYVIQLHQDQWEGQRWNRSPGNLYSNVKKVYINPEGQETIKLVCSNVIPPVKMPRDTKWVKYIKIKSKLISEFWGRPMYLGAVVLLPEGYETHPDVYYPVNYIQGHFSLRPPYRFREGTSFYRAWTSKNFPRMIAVTFQHPNPYYDDSYCVNSANVGPYGDALTKELIPYLEKKFRIISKPYARVLSGGSTGGWASLAMQVFYPDFFGGTFSLCPDPVDFRYYQIVNIYKDRNAYYKEYDWLKVERPNNRATDGSIRYMMKDENLYELVIGDKSRSGGQWAIWEAVYSPVGKDGYPEPIWDKLTGEINHSVAEYWKEHYDLRYYLEKNWSWLGPKLVGKLHIYVGDMDTYYLNNAVKLLERFLENTKNPYYAGTVEYGDGKPHCWGPRGTELIKLIADYITKNAPEGEDTSKWKY